VKPLNWSIFHNLPFGEIDAGGRVKGLTQT
jgi:hypothetical protein